MFVGNQSSRGGQGRKGPSGQRKSWEEGGKDHVTKKRDLTLDFGGGRRIFLQEKKGGSHLAKKRFGESRSREGPGERRIKVSFSWGQIR